jgi:hypothetical protein
MIVVTLLLILVAVVLLVLGLAAGSSTMLIGSIVASLLAAVALVIGARQAATRRRATVAGGVPAGPDDDPFLAEGQSPAEFATAGARRAPADGPGVAGTHTAQGSRAAENARHAGPVDDFPPPPPPAPADAEDDFAQPARSADDFPPPGRHADDFPPPGRPADDFSPPGRATDDVAPAGRAADDFRASGRAPDDFPPPGRAADDFAPPGRAADDFPPPPGRDADDDDLDEADEEHYAREADDYGPPVGAPRSDFSGSDPILDRDEEMFRRPAADAPDYDRASSVIGAARAEDDESWRRPGDQPLLMDEDDEADDAASRRNERDNPRGGRVPADEDFAEADEDDPEDEPLPQAVRPGDAIRVARMDDEVLVVDGRPRYHMADCHHLTGRLTEPIPVGEAVELGFNPCGLCRPVDRLIAQTARR